MPHAAHATRHGPGGLQCSCLRRASALGAIGCLTLTFEVLAAEPPIEFVVYGGDSDRGASPGRATSRVSRRDLDERLPRSAPDALRYEPGVYVQQSAHGQGSPYIRGRTGQQTLVLFDGIRVNTSTWRQGPNQYFFTIDSRWIHSLEVIRGGASTLYGSDAMAGVIDASPLEPRLELEAESPRVRPRSMLRWASADGDFSNRLQLDVQLSPGLRFLVGGGYRDAGRLESAGPVKSPQSGDLPQVPAFEKDGRTQLGTGFTEVTYDGRLAAATTRRSRFVAATYGYRQLDAPRTDQCPPPFAPRDECLNYDEQFRTLAYVAHEGYLGAAAEHSNVSLSYQRQHERRTLDRPGSFVRNGGRDDIDTFGVSAKLTSARWELPSLTTVRLRYGGDFYHDRVSSKAWTQFTDVEALIPRSRGQYVQGSAYWTGGVYTESELELARRVVLRTGARAAVARATAPADDASGTDGVDATWLALAGNVGIEWRATDVLALLATWDRSFRAPNLDDLTSRQQSGPGFQFENADLEPEFADTFELGLRGTHEQFELDAFVYRTLTHAAITRAIRGAEECPPATPQCALSWSRFQLVNLSSDSKVDGFELSARASVLPELMLRATVSYAYGEGPNPAQASSDPSLPFHSRVPLSRVPPLNGSAEARWAFLPDGYVGGALRWALLQDRLAPTDRSDARIPEGGTPGFSVFDLRAGWRIRRELVFALVIENVGDTPYRYHGSSVNGAGRGLILGLESGL